MSVITREDYVEKLKVKFSFLSDEEISSLYDANLEIMLAENKQTEKEMQMGEAAELFVKNASQSMTDEDASKIDMLFPDWKVGGNYEQGDILRYNGALYRVSQKVTCAQADHTPDKAVSLYKRIGEPTGGLFSWSQPQDAHDAYKKGDKVKHNGKTWVSTVDNNVWEPGVYGWNEVV